MKILKKKKGILFFVLLVMCIALLPVNQVEAEYVPKKQRVNVGTWYWPADWSGSDLSDYAGCYNKYCLLCGYKHEGKKGDGDWNYDVDPSTGQIIHGTEGTSHRGIDIVNKSSTSVYASNSGWVVYYNNPKDGRGNTLIMEHPIEGSNYSYYTLYQHLASKTSNITVDSKKSADNKVSVGTKIATMGNTGGNYGVHLHFEMFYLTKNYNFSEKGIPGFGTGFMEYTGKPTGLINVNTGIFDGNQTKGSSRYHAGSITYVNDKLKVPAPKALTTDSKSSSSGVTTLTTTSFIHPTGTYQVGPKFTGMKEDRVIRKGKTEKTDIIVHLPEGAKVYVKETYQNDNVAKVVYKANNTTYNGYMYIADKVGKQKFTKINDKDITPKAITAAPVVSATTATSISVGKNASFKWNAVANATKYLVTVKKGSTEVSKQEVTGTTYSYTFANQGSYSVTIQAKNDAFWSSNSSAVTVTVNNPVTVTFKDYDGTVISKQTVEYGGDAKVPSTPNGRVGYTFREWDKSYRGVKADTVITAQYDINTYKVRFFDGNGVQIGSTQYITYKSDAKAPAIEEVTVKEGYTFVQWDKQYTTVTSDTDVYALTAWENANLPITVVTAKAEQNVDDGVVSSYTVTATLRNTNTEDTTGRAIVALTTKEGDLLTATESNAFTVKNGVDFDLQITVPYKGQATNAEIYIVNGYQYTSNSFKKDGTIPISKKYSVSCEKSVDALAFTEWTTETAPTDAIGVESKNQYASRSVSTTNQYKHTFYPTNWSEYTTTPLTGSSTRKVTSKKQYRYRDVGAWGAEQSTTTKPTEGTLLTITSSSTAYYYYHYMNQYTDGSYGADSVASGSRNGYTIKNNLGKCVYKRGSKITSTCNYGDIGGKQQYSVSTGCSSLSGVTSRSGHCGSPGWKFWYYDKAVTTYKYKTRAWGAWSAWQDETVTASTTRGVESRTVYAYKDAKIVYNNDPNYTLAGYTKESTVLNSSNTTYGSWSDWSDTKVSGSNLEVKERTVYRWKTKEEIVTGDTVEGETKEVSGNLSVNFAGKEAILFVYKNGDASDYTTEYLGQTTIADDGSYYFEFKTREEPSVMTGDFTATLGIEGTDTVMILDESNYANADQFKAPAEEFTVEFVDRDGNLLSTQQVQRGQSAILPEDIPSIEGHTFTGWSANVTNIQGDYTIDNNNPIIAQYKVNTYEVLFVDWVEDKMESVVYEYGEALKAPEGLELQSNVEGRTKVWSHSFDGTQLVTDDIVVTAHEETQTFTIHYYDMEDELYATDTVDYGTSVQLIDSYNLSTEDILVYGWKLNVPEEELKYVTQNIEAKPNYSYFENADAPVASVESGVYTEQQKVTLSTENIDADIYYTLDGSDPKNNGFLFNYPITIDSTCILRTYAKLENSNDSAEAIYYYAINSEENTESDWYLLEDLPEEVISNQDRYELESKIGYRYRVTKQVMSDEEATALQKEGWQQVGEVAYTEYSDYMTELPEGIGAAEMEVVEGEDGVTLYRYRYGIWTFTNMSKWQTNKPDVADYEMNTIYRYDLPKECILTLEMQGEEPQKEFVYLNEVLDIDLSKYVSPGEVIVGLYRDASCSDAWDMETDIITESTTLYLKKEYKKVKVQYFDKDGNLITDNEILYGEDAEDIPMAKVEGYTFVGWDKSLKNITEDTDFYAQYKENAIAKEITLNVSKKSLFTATSYQLTATVEGESNYKNLDWSSSNDNIAIVSDSGLVTGVHAGKVTITAKLESGERAICEITVIGDEEYELLLKTVSELTVNRENDTLVLEQSVSVEELKNEFQNKSLTIYNTSGVTMEDKEVVTTACTIKDADDELEVVVLGDANSDAMIDETDYDVISTMISAGLDYLDVGTARYCAADLNQDRLLDSLDLVVLSNMLYPDVSTDVLATAIELSATTLELEVGGQSKITTTILPSDAAIQTVEWSSSNTKVATVDGNGNVIAIAEGTANIIVTAKDGSGVESVCVVTITKKQETTQQSGTGDSTADEPGEGNSSNEQPSTSEVLSAVGTKTTLSSGQYKVTKSSATTKEVTFVKPKSSKKKSITVPATVTIDGHIYEVTAIADKAFKNNKKLKSVTIGKNVTKIGKQAFYNCKNLKKITIKSAVLKNVGRNAIKGIDKKATIKVPKQQLKKYKNLFKSKTGYKKTMKIKK